jgi:hypothetical protein
MADGVDVQAITVGDEARSITTRKARAEEE